MTLESDTYIASAVKCTVTSYPLRLAPSPHIMKHALFYFGAEAYMARISKENNQIAFEWELNQFTKAPVAAEE